MFDKIRIFVGLIVFLALAAFPIWYALGITNDVPTPDFPSDLEIPRNFSKCVKDKEYMIANHMDILDQWRDEVIRQGDNSPIKIDGKEYEKSLTKGCMHCHTSRENFCAKCHNYADVQPTCWDCHLEPKGD